MPKAVTGKPYKLFEAAASVGKIKTDVKTEVFYRYGNHSKLRIEIGNGCFIPEWDGEYEIVYSARNFYKETTAETLTVTAVSDYTELAIVTEPDSGNKSPRRIERRTNRQFAPYLHRRLRRVFRGII